MVERGERLGFTIPSYMLCQNYDTKMKNTIHPRSFIYRVAFLIDSKKDPIIKIDVHKLSMPFLSVTMYTASHGPFYQTKL
jgi:hypothetical protein